MKVHSEELFFLIRLISVPQNRLGCIKHTVCINMFMLMETTSLQSATQIVTHYVT